MERRNYVLVTPARNEQAFIEKTLQSVTRQTVLPRKWIIVSDGSTDRTDDIVSRYAAEHAFIQLVRTSGEVKRNFSSKVYAFNAGYARLQGVDYDFIGMLDADVSFSPDYYENILKEFNRNEQLGLAGGIRYDLCNGKFVRVLCAKNSVGGPFQLFRRQCFEAIGGFTPIKIGGEDAVAEIMARMHGWRVESFPEFKVFHYRRTGTATQGALRVQFQNGERCYLLGYHPLFHLAKSIFRIKERPRFFGSLWLLAGYLVAALTRVERPVSKDMVHFLRAEQLARVKSIVLRRKDFALTTLKDSCVIPGEIAPGKEIFAAHQLSKQ